MGKCASYPAPSTGGEKIFSLTGYLQAELLRAVRFQLRRNAPWPAAGRRTAGRGRIGGGLFAPASGRGGFLACLAAALRASYRRAGRFRGALNALGGRDNCCRHVSNLLQEWAFIMAKASPATRTRSGYSAHHDLPSSDQRHSCDWNFSNSSCSSKLER